MTVPGQCTFCPRARQQYFVYRRNFNWPHGCVRDGTLHYILGQEGMGAGVSDFVASPA
jgi:hypothetical protein